MRFYPVILLQVLIFYSCTSDTAHHSQSPGPGVPFVVTKDTVPVISEDSVGHIYLNARYITPIRLDSAFQKLKLKQRVEVYYDCRQHRRDCPPKNSIVVRLAEIHGIMVAPLIPSPDFEFVPAESPFR
jgi:hypothetical protein